MLSKYQQEIRGYIPGSGMIKLRTRPGHTIENNHNRFLLNIPKNASSYLGSWANKNGWSTALASDVVHVEEIVIVLRDPLERWISGFVQYAQSYILSVDDQNWSSDDFIAMYNPLVERLIFDVIDQFDDHTLMQKEVIDGIFLDAKKTYFMVDEVDSKLGPYLNFTPDSNIDRNTISSSNDMLKLQKFIKQQLQNRPDLEKRVIKRYQPDYDLIKQVRPDVRL